VSLSQRHLFLTDSVRKFGKLLIAKLGSSCLILKRFSMKFTSRERWAILAQR